MRLQPAHLYEAAAHHEEGHQIGQHKVGQIVAESGFLVKVFFKNLVVIVTQFVLQRVDGEMADRRRRWSIRSPRSQWMSLT